MNAFPPTLSNPVTMLPGAALGDGMEGSLLPGAARLLGLRFCSRSEAMLSLLHVRAILPERGPSAAAAVEAGRVGTGDIARERSEGSVRDEGMPSELLDAGTPPSWRERRPWSRSSWNRSSFCVWRGTPLP